MELTLLYERDHLQKAYMDLCRELGDMYVGVDSKEHMNDLTNEVRRLQRELKRMNMEILLDSIDFAQQEGFIKPNEVEVIKERMHNSGILKRPREN